MYKFYYNDVLLPRLPHEVKIANPNIWIRENKTSGYYDLIFSTSSMYHDGNTSIGYGTAQTALCEWYRVSIEGAESATEWEFYQSLVTWWGLDSSRTVLWSNIDIPTPNITSETVYFKGTDPVLYVPEEAKSVTRNYYNGILLPEIPQDVLTNYPYCWLRTNFTTGYYNVIFGKGPWYNSGESTTALALMYCSDDTDIVYYSIPLDCVEAATGWDFTGSATGAYGVDSNRIFSWSNHDIITGLISDIFFEGSEVQPQYPVVHEWYKITKKTLIGFADEARRLGNKPNQQLTTKEIKDTLSKVVLDVPPGSVLANPQIRTIESKQLFNFVLVPNFNSWEVLE